MSDSIIAGRKYWSKTGAILTPRLVDEGKGTIMYTNSVSEDLHEVSLQKFNDLLETDPTMSDSMNDKRDEVEVENPFEVMEACKTNTVWHTEMMTDVCYVPIETIDAILAANRDLIAANAQKDAEIERMKEKPHVNKEYGTHPISDKRLAEMCEETKWWKHDEDEIYRVVHELKDARAELRASVGEKEQKAIKLLESERGSTFHEKHTKDRDYKYSNGIYILTCFFCKDIDAILAPPTLHTEKES